MTANKNCIEINFIVTHREAHLLVVRPGHMADDVPLRDAQRAAACTEVDRL